MSVFDKLIDKAVDAATGLVGQAVDTIPDLVGAGMDAAFDKADQYIEENKLIDKGLDGALNLVSGSAPIAAASATSAAQLTGNVKPHSTELADGTIVLEPGNTPDALHAEAALKNGHKMPGEKPLSAKWWEDMSKGGPTDLLSQYNVIDPATSQLNFKGLGDLFKAFIAHIMPRGEHGARMASNGSFKDLKFEDGSPAVIPKEVEPIDPKTGKTPEPEPAINPLDPRMQPMAMGMNNPTPGMKFA
jgi:hypothetical protein